jgi:hypothetical protein
LIQGKLIYKKHPDNTPSPLFELTGKKKNPRRLSPGFMAKPYLGYIKSALAPA